MADATVDLVKERTDIVALIGESLPLKRAGSSFKSRCPFHEEDTPSFMVSPTRQMYHCFGCGESGDVFSWLVKREGMSFPEALRVLAQRAGVPLTFERAERREERERLRETIDLAATFYHRVLLESAEGKEARAYLEGRGLSAESIARWRLGYCPESATGITEKARERQITEEDLARTGILYRGQRTFEFFHGRILFPLSDVHGSAVGLAGRVFGDTRPEAPKYINTPETALYVKSRVLYGLDRAKETIRKENLAIIVEGYTDVILSHQVGVTHVIATSGTALTTDHLQSLRRFTDRLAFAFDADTAGDNATRRAVDLALAAGFLVSVIDLPAGDDPADLAVRDPAAWRGAVRQQRDLFVFLLDRARRRHPTDTAEAKKSILTDLLPVAAAIPDQVVVGKYVQELARNLNVEARYIAEDLQRWKIAQRSRSAGADRTVPAASLRSITGGTNVRREERVLTLLLADRTLIPRVAGVLPEAAFEAPHTKALYVQLKSWYGTKRVLPGSPPTEGPAQGDLEGRTPEHAWTADLRATLPEDLQRFLDILLFAVDVDRDADEWNPALEARGLVRDVRLACLRRELQARTEHLRTAAAPEREALLREMSAVTADVARAEREEW